MKEGEVTNWEYKIKRDDKEFIPYNSHKMFTLPISSTSFSGNYQCCGCKRSSHDPKCSNVLSLTVSGRPKPTLTPGTTTISVGGTVRLTCSVERSDGWKYEWFRRTSDTNEVQLSTHDGQNKVISVSRGGIYRCRGGRGNPDFYTDISDEVTIHITFLNKPVLRQQPDWSPTFSGEMITLTCEVSGGESTEWVYEWRRARSVVHHENKKYWKFRASESISGDYDCRRRLSDDSYSSTDWSEAITLSVSPQPKARLSAASGTISAKGSLTLTCSVNPSSGWQYYWYRDDKPSGPLTSQDAAFHSNGQIDVSQGGLYQCRTGRGDPVYYTKYSDSVTINKNVPNRTVVSLQPNWPQIYRGEKITLKCEISGGDVEWEYKWRSSSSYKPPNQNEFSIYSASSIHSGNYECKGTMKSSEHSTYYSGNYQCCGRKRSSHDPKCSNVLSLTVSGRPKPTLTPGTTTISVGDTVRLTCSVERSDGWKYEWFSRTSDTKEVQLSTNDGQDGVISVSQGGIYRCRGGRGNTDFYTYLSDKVTIHITFLNKPVLRQQPDWSPTFSGEMITLTCEVSGGESTEWVYEWRRARSVVHHENKKYWKLRASESISGDYDCRRRLRDDSYSSTEWSDSFSLMILKRPLSVLTVSPSWLSPGASVTLSCVVQHPSAGWRFYWYKALPDISDKFGSYIKELLPGSINGTAQDSYIVHGQRDTAGYLCKAGRGDPEYHTVYSNPKFVWSGDFNPSASLTVNPDRAQHFTSDSVSLTCEGNSAEWRVRRFNDTSSLSYCSFWGTMKGSTCNVHEFSTTVYWCESGSAFSNAVNITGQRDDIILVSPVHPATEGSSVILDCKLRTENVLSNVIFYKNDKIIQNDPRGQMIISAVSTTDEGFYKCQYSGKESPQGWMAVKSVSRAESSSSVFHVLLIVGLLCGISLIILLLLFCRYKQSKDSCFVRVQSTSQSSTTDHMTKQDEAQHNTYAALLHGDVSIYESIKSPDDENGAIYEVAI
ncbi:Fc receptor-like protein 5 [Embiotoca jacksoni]|uniref:Fc receptor-like protein 5 n=1 Tax=Embiotoca jacksoni TaxID=100190 RepID=UPI0037037160